MRDATRLERNTHAIRGDRAELHLQDGTITITKHVPTRPEPVSVTFPLDRVRGATLERPSRGVPGWLHVAVVGGTVVPTTSLAAATDPYTVTVTGGTVSAARKLARMVTEHLRARGVPPDAPGEQSGSSSVLVSRRTPAPPVPPPAPPPPAGGPVDQGSPGLAADGTVARDQRTGGDQALADHARTAVDEMVTADEVVADDERVGGQAVGDDVAPTDDPGGRLDGDDVDGPELAGHLRDLAELHRAGALTDDEFARAKARVLGAAP